MDYFLIAKIVQLYGRDGFVKLKSFSDFPDRYFSLNKVYIDFWGDKKTFHIEHIKDVSGKIIVKFKRFDNARDCQVLIDRDVYITESDLVSLPENYFYVHNLIGCEVIASEERMGTVTNVLKTKANDVLVISTDDNEEKLIPFVLNFIEKFDVARKKLILNVSKDFFEDDED